MGPESGPPSEGAGPRTHPDPRPSDRGALARSYDRNAALVFGLLLRIVGERGVAERLLVQVFAGLEPAELEPAGAPRSDRETTVWLVQRARELALAAGSGARGSPPTALPEPAAHVVPFCRDSQRVAQVRASLGRLPMLDRELLELAYFNGLGSRAIAARCGLDLADVHARLRKALGSISLERRVCSKEVPT